MTKRKQHNPEFKARVALEAVKGYADGRAARAGIDVWIEFYNDRRPHHTRGDRTPMAVWRVGIAQSDNSAVDMRRAWTTPARRPHAHSARSDNRRCVSQLEKQTRRRPRFHPSQASSWSHGWVHFTCGKREYRTISLN